MHVAADAGAALRQQLQPGAGMGDVDRVVGRVSGHGGMCCPPREAAVERGVMYLPPSRLASLSPTASCAPIGAAKTHPLPPAPAPTLAPGPAPHSQLHHVLPPVAPPRLHHPHRHLRVAPAAAAARHRQRQVGGGRHPPAAVGGAHGRVEERPLQRL